MDLRYLIIEDSLFVRELIKITVNSFGWHLVGESDDVDEGMDLVENYRPHVIIVDLVLPKKNGLGFIQQIRKQFPEIKIIACSTLIEPAIQKMALDAGSDYFLKKPFTRSSVGDVINHIISKRLNKEGELG